MRTLILLIVLQVASFWPVWRWYAFCTIDNSGDEYALLALGTGLAMVWWNRARAIREVETSLWIPASLVLLYTLIYRFIPMEFRAGLAFVSLSLTLNLLSCRRLPHIGVIGLFLLSLPIVPSLQFYLGYPMRVIVAQITAPWLGMAGFPVVTQGTCLTFGDRLIWIDAPCSGIRMLWVSGYLACTLSLLYRLSNSRTVVVGLCTLPAVIMANCLRSASLFYIEADIIVVPSWAHQVIGVIVFGILALAMLAIVRQLRIPTSKEQKPEGPDKNGISLSFPSVRLFILICILAGTAPMLPVSRMLHQVTKSFPGWPETFEGRPIKQLELSERERKFYRDFPGETALFTDGKRHIIIRWVTNPTRKLHPASDCFLAEGGHIKPLPLYRDKNGDIWGAFEVVRRDLRLLVHEQFRDNDGKTWSDVSSWYWAAILNKTKGPWWVNVVVNNRANP